MVLPETSAEQATQADNVNLVPTQAATAANYWCTWYAQNYWIQRGGEITNFSGITNANAREELNEHTLYNKKDGWASTYLPRGRSDYFFLIDHGWQDKEKSHLLPGATPFFSLQLDKADFPRYAAHSHAESLRKFNEDIQTLGWRGLGLWTRGNISKDAAERMVNWSKHAGIEYWKIDGGGTQHFYSYALKQKLYPELILEYICGANGPLNPQWKDATRNSYPSVYAPGGAKNKIALKIIQNCDVFRTYDVAPILVSTSTMRRIHDILRQTQGNPSYIAQLNIQDDTQVAAGMGCLVAVKRHPNYMERTLDGKDFHHQISGKRLIQKRMNEVERFGRWQRIAPAFPAGIGSYLASEEELIDSYPHTKQHTWFKPVYGQMVYQSAPAIMARNMPLPKVEASADAPYVMASTYPNGPLCVATEGRVKPDDQWYHPRAKVTVQVKDAHQPIGVFGHYQQLVLEFDGPLDGIRHIWAQDLLTEKAEDIRDQVNITGHSLIIPGKLIDRLGTSAGDPGDISVPGLVIRLEGDKLPIAGSDYTPAAARPSRERAIDRDRSPDTTSKASAKPSAKLPGFHGNANIQQSDMGYLVSPGTSQPAGSPGIILKELPKKISSGKTSIQWKMKAADPNAATRNGFLVLSSGKDAMNAVFAGSWIGSRQLSVFEQSARWGEGLKKPLKQGAIKELDCKAVLDMDARTLILTINGKTITQSFSEAITTVDYIGFAVKDAKTEFSEPRIR